MTKNDLPSLRILAANGQIVYTKHALKRILERGYSTDSVKDILKSSTNQLIEVQPPSKTPGKEHADERSLISDPQFSPDALILVSIDISSSPLIIVLTVEDAYDHVWKKDRGAEPWLVRK